MEHGLPCSATAFYSVGDRSESLDRFAKRVWVPITQMRTRNVGWPAGDVAGRARLRDVEVSAEGAADEVALGGVFFVGALLKGVPQLWVESDGDDL